jgi:hypothetical protein
MDFSKYKKLEKQLETNNFELNFSTLDKTLYYFSFLGNIFLVLFSYFFIKNVTNTIPHLFPGQDLFFSIFVILFMSGYELFKRFAFEQLISSIIRTKLLTLNNIIGVVVCSFLIAGSFYLSLNGAHRLIDTSETITIVADSTTAQKQQDLLKERDNKLQLIRQQPGRTRVDRRYKDSLETATTAYYDNKIQQIETKTQDKTSTQLEKNKQNDVAFIFMTFFLELIILIGVGFRGYYTINAYNETKDLFSRPKYKQLEECLTLLSIVYVKGKKKKNDVLTPITKLSSTVSTQKLNITQKALKDFYNLMDELEITKAETKRRRIYNTDYETAKQLIQQAFLD